MKRLLVLFALLLTGCGAVRQAAPAPVVQADYYPMQQASFTFTDTDASGAFIGYTFVDMKPLASGSACVNTPSVGKLQTKDAIGAYWGVNAPGAWDEEAYTKHDDGSVWLVGTQGGATVSNPWLPAQLSVSDSGFAILPDTATQGRILAGDTVVQAQARVYSFTQQGVLTFDCLNGKAPESVEQWRVTWKTVNVSTPAYTGTAIAATLQEGAAVTQGYISEIHYFAPDLGLVQVDVYYNGKLIQTDKRH